MSPPLAAALAAFLGPYDHYLGWHDGYNPDLSLLDALAPADRVAAEAALLQELGGPSPDPRAIIGLGHLRSRPALPLLHQQLVRAGAYALHAIAQIDPAALDAAQVLALLRSPALSEYQLLDLALGLGHYFTLAQLDPRLPAQLLALLASPHYLVRYHALAALRRLHHLPDATQRNASAAELRRDQLFGLIGDDGRGPADFRRAQQQLQEQIAAAGK